MKNIFLNHPTFSHTQDIKDICAPLLKLNISYFAHVRMDEKNHYTVISNGPEFLRHYLNNKYYNADIPAAKNNSFNKYVIWDGLERTGLSAKMHTEAAMYGIQHTFNIIERTGSKTDYYFFANASHCRSINQVYLNNIDLLELFISYFKNKINASPTLKKAYEHSIILDPKRSNYNITDRSFNYNEEVRHQLIGQLMQPTYQSEQPIILNPTQITEESSIAQSIKLTFPDLYLTKREQDCLTLTVKGKTAKHIALQLKISPRTVEHHLQNIKIKLDITSKRDLVAAILDNMLY